MFPILSTTPAEYVERNQKPFNTELVHAVH